MEVKVVREKLNYLLENPEDDARYQAYMRSYTNLLDKVKVNSDTANLAIESVDIDQGVNFLDTFVALEEKKSQDAWKIIRGCEEFKANANYNALKLMCSFAISAIGGDRNACKLLGNIFTAVVNALKLPKQKEVQQDAYRIIKECLIEQLPVLVKKYPEWDKVKMTYESGIIFCNVLSQSIKLVDNKNAEFHLLKKWISDGEVHFRTVKESKEREKNKPHKKSNELLALAEHFKSLEEKLDKTISENVSLVLESLRLQEQLEKEQNDKKDLERTINKLREEIDALNVEIITAKREVNERKKLNDAQIQYREDAQVSLLQDIARALKAEYGDYAETLDMPMNEMLGEIYREKLKQIFKILEQKGIKVE